MAACPSRLSYHACSLDKDVNHDVHVELNTQGVVLARWRMEAVELPLSEALAKETLDVHQ